MKFSSTRVILLTLCLAARLWAAPFQNLGFDGANTANLEPGSQDPGLVQRLCEK
jgi:hypothetical protein